MSGLPKVMILPVEILQREMDGRLLHALIALQKGWSVILGSKLEINRNIWRLPRGVYLFSTLSQKRVTMARMLKKMGFASQGWDEEGLVYLNRNLYLARRISSQTLYYIDQVFSWGEISQHDLEIKSSLARKTVKDIGNPRFDLLRPQFHSIYNEEVTKIRSNIGKFVLLNTNFPSVNFIYEKLDMKNKKMENENDFLAAQLYERLRNHRKFMFLTFLQAIPRIAEALPPHYQLVVRPHPAENIDTWRTAIKHCSNASVIAEGPSIPWLLAADALVHNDCTTAVEMRLLGREPIAYIPQHMPDGATFLPNAISHHASTITELHDLLTEAIKGNLHITTHQQEVLNKYISNINGPLASEKAVNSAEELVKTNLSLMRATRGRLFGLGRHIWKEIHPRGRHSRKYISKVYPINSVNYIQNRIIHIANCIDLDYKKIQINKVNKSIFIIKIK